MGGLGPSGFDIARSANIVKVGCGNVTCIWNFEIPDSETSNSSTVIFSCDSFLVGLGQESGRCWGDSLYIRSPENDTLTLCGKRDGIHLTLEGYSENIEVEYSSGNSVETEGFSCLIYLEEKDPNLPNMISENTDYDHNCECGISNEVKPGQQDVIIQKVIGGEDVKGNEFPWQVALVKKDLYKPFCGGSLISDKHVLTAAHCTQEMGSSKDLEVLLGEHDLTTTFDFTFRMPVARIIEHPLYNPLTVTNDFAIIVLAEEIRFSSFVRPICLPVLNEEMFKNDFANEETLLTGWGFTTLSPEHGTDPRPERLKKLSLKVLDHEDCQSRWNTQNYTVGITPSMMCAKPDDPKTSACMGDSGGPLAYKDSNGKYSVVGVVSFGPKTCIDPLLPNVYARVTSALQWIVFYVKQSRLCLSPKEKLLAETLL